MKKVVKFFVKHYLRLLSKALIFIHRPFVIAIAGSTNKTFAKEAINRNLHSLKYVVRSNPKSFNTEFGLPLAILNLPSGYGSISAWIKIMFEATGRLFNTNFPKLLVLEFGVSFAGDMKYLLSIVRPNIAIITEITQRYLESFNDIDELIDEYRLLCRTVNKKNYLLLNYDNIWIRELSADSPSQVLYFGLDKTYQGLTNNWWQGEINEKSNNGQKISIKHAGKTQLISIKGHGAHHVYAQTISSIVVDIVINNFSNLNESQS